MIRRFLATVLLSVVCGSHVQAVAQAVKAGGETQSPAGLALESIFSPLRAPENKTMGLTQRSFLDLVESSRTKLEIALVIDGTESMRDSLSGIRATLGSMVADLRLFKGADVRLQVVVFRDGGAKSGEIEFPLKVAGRRFTGDEKSLADAIAAIEPESGAPYFPELIDLGIETAITDLEWTEDDETTRWILVFGDAPPFSAGFSEPETGARRRVATDQLISQAASRNIKISCILCTSREDDKAAYETVLDELRVFMGELSSGTGGLMLDLSYPEIRAAIEQAAKRPRVSYTEIGKISEEDVQVVRAQTAAARASLSSAPPVRIAVLPHLPLDKMSFNANLPEVLLAADLRHRLRQVPGLQIESSGTIRRQFDLLASRGIPAQSSLASLAAMMKVDYIIWGQSAQAQGLLSLDSAIYDGIDGKPIVQDSVRVSGPLFGEASTELVRGLVNKLTRQKSDEPLVLALASLRTTPAVASELLTRVSNRSEVEGPLLAGYEFLEQATAWRGGEAAGTDLLRRAEEALVAAVGPQGDPQNGFGHLLLANCYFNQAMGLTQSGNDADAGERLRLFRGAMNQAYQFRSRAANESTRTEIEADFALFIKNDARSAIERYQALSGDRPAETEPLAPAIQSHTALRAHWMLAGIYAGDWHVAPELIDASKSRAHLLQILANWPDSSEAQFIRVSLRWNQKLGQSELTQLPNYYEPLAKQLAQPEPPK